MKRYHVDTQCLHSGWCPQNGEARQLPIHQSTTFRYDSVDTLGDLFDLKTSGYFYSRVANPTNDAVARKICDLEGGVAAVLTASGQAAAFFALFNLCHAGDHIVCSATIYGGVHNLFNVTFRRMGIDVTFISPFSSEAEIAAAILPNTKAIYGETIANPALIVLDIPKFSRVAHAHGVPLIVDNTFPTPVFCRPIEHGADIVIHSTTKYMDGHAAVVGGAIIDSGRFDWGAYPEKFSDFCTPDPSYHGLVYTKAFGEGAYITKLLVQLMRDLGAVPSPFNSYILNLGLESLHLRMRRHVDNATQIATFLKAHPAVEWVKFPGLASDDQAELVKTLMPDGTCGVVSFGVKGGREAAKTVINAFQLIAIQTHVADAKTCALHPASTTHRQLDEAALQAAGVDESLIRISVGIEAVADLIADLKQALEQLSEA